MKNINYEKKEEKLEEEKVEEEKLEEEKVEQERIRKARLKRLRKELCEIYILFIPCMLHTIIMDIMALPFRIIYLIGKHPGLEIEGIINDMNDTFKENGTEYYKNINLRGRDYLILYTAWVYQHIKNMIRETKSEYDIA